MGNQQGGGGGQKVGSEHHRLMGISGMSGDDGVDTGRHPTGTASFDPRSQLARPTGRCLLSVYGPDPTISWLIGASWGRPVIVSKASRSE